MLAPITTNASTDNQVIVMWLSGKASTSQVTYTSAVKQFLSFVGKGLKEVVLEDFQMWASSLEMRYNPNTVKLKVNTIKSLLSYGQKIGYLQFNVGSAVTAPKPKDTLSQRILALEDVKALIGAAQTQRDRTLLALMYGCGLRVSELCGLTWDDLQPRDDGGQATVYGKGSKTRVVLIPVVLWQRLMSLSRSASTDAVFVSRTGRALERTMVHRIIKDCASRAGVSEKASSHWLRHSHATHAIEGGCDLHLLQQSLGHSSLAITSKYLHARPDQGSSQFVATVLDD